MTRLWRQLHFGTSIFQINYSIIHYLNYFNRGRAIESINAKDFKLLQKHAEVIDKVSDFQLLRKSKKNYLDILKEINQNPGLFKTLWRIK